MASLPTVPCLTIGHHRGIARSVASVLAPHGFSVNGILSMNPWSDSELASALRVLEPRPQVLLLGGGYADEDAEKAQTVFDEYTKEVDIPNGRMVRVAPGVVEKVGPKGVAGWILDSYRGILGLDDEFGVGSYSCIGDFYNHRAKIAEVSSLDPQS